MLFPHDQGGWTLELPAVAWWALDLPGFSNYLLVLMTRLVFNRHTAYSDVGGTIMLKIRLIFLIEIPSDGSLYTKEFFGRQVCVC
jgi:hypothetical protein